MATAPTDIRGVRPLGHWARIVRIAQGQGALGALVLLVLLGVLRYGDTFYGAYNVSEMLRYNSMFGLIGLGMTFVIMTGGIDLSVGSLVALASVVAALLSPYGALPALIMPVLMCGLIGLFSGWVIAWLHIPPFITTLAMLMATRGVALILANNAFVGVDGSSGFAEINQGGIFGVPVPVVIMIAAYMLGSLMLNYTRFGRHILAVGGNEESARLMGLPVAWIKCGVYALSGALAGLTGVILAAQTFTGLPTAGIGWELQVIAAVVVGGTLLTGGMGSVGTTLIGVLLLGLIFNILNFENGRGVISLSVYWQSVIRGAFLLVVVILQSRLTRRR
ncbi:MAG: ABC transporter permease [Roseiflexaceae bacterium]